MMVPASVTGSPDSSQVLAVQCTALEHRIDAVAVSLTVIDVRRRSSISMGDIQRSFWTKHQVPSGMVRGVLTPAVPNRGLRDHHTAARRQAAQTGIRSGSCFHRRDIGP